jgi:hypothetical protein
MPDVLAGFENQYNRTSSDGEDVVTYRCLPHGDISVVNRVEAADM